LFLVLLRGRREKSMGSPCSMKSPCRDCPDEKSKNKLTDITVMGKPIIGCAIGCLRLAAFQAVLADPDRPIINDVAFSTNRLVFSTDVEVSSRLRGRVPAQP